MFTITSGHDYDHKYRYLSFSVLKGKNTEAVMKRLAGILGETEVLVFNSFGVQATGTCFLLWT